MVLFHFYPGKINEVKPDIVIDDIKIDDISLKIRFGCGKSGKKYNEN